MTKLRLAIAALAVSAAPAFAGGIPAFDLPRLDFGATATMSSSGVAPVALPERPASR
ncbi:MAG: hypothetical protein KF887_01790 [Paracoccaceae bacterium]|nr:MAG: hypothetical protein KF887_01790 [Paracoccaceae bacterium]